MRVRQVLGPHERLTNAVIMGTGEPLANYDATMAAVRTLNADWGLRIGARKITISTVGLPAQMRRLADEGLQVTLALSLHAPTDELRRQIIPWAERVALDDLVAAASYYFERTGREVTIEYVLLGGLNDRREHAEQLAALSRRMRSNVNLLVYNPVPGLKFRTTRPARGGAVPGHPAWGGGERAPAPQSGPGYRGRLRPTASARSSDRTPTHLDCHQARLTEHPHELHIPAGIPHGCQSTAALPEY